MRTIAAALAVVCFTSSPVESQAPATPAQPQRPAGIIHGRVVLPNGRPAQRARVSATAPPGGFPRTAITNRDGVYEIDGIAPGEYRVSAGKPGYVVVDFGQRRAFERGKLVPVKGGETTDGVDITLQPSGAVSGRVVDENGDPVEGIQVRLLRTIFLAGRRQLFPVGDVGARNTNDQGRYRLYGVPPGQYAIVASLSDRPGDPGNVLLPPGYQATYFPGRLRPAEARFVTIDLGEEIDNADITLGRGSGATIRGTVVDSQGKPAAAGIVVGTSQRSGGVGAEPTLVHSSSDGTFEVRDLPPGEYVLQVNKGGGPGDVNLGREPQFAARFVSVADADVDGVNIRLSAGSRVDGRIVFEGGDVRDFKSVTIDTMPADFDLASMIGPSARATARADGTFTIEGLNGPRRFHLMHAPDGWSLKSIRTNGRDITDEALTFGTADDSLTDVEVVLTNRPASIAGNVADAQGRSVDDYTAIVFATARDRWYPQSRYAAFRRPNADGAFTVPNLPPGEYYVAAVDRLQAGTNGDPYGDMQDPSFLESLVPRATRIALTEGQAATVALRVIVR